MARAATTTTAGAAPASSRSMTATWALPPKRSGPVSQPAKVGMSARAALTPMTRPNGTMPASHGTMARAPASTSAAPSESGWTTARSAVASMGGSGVALGPVAGDAGHRTVRRSAGVDLDRDRDAVGEDVEHRGAGPGLLDERPSFSAGASPFTSKDTRIAWKPLRTSGSSPRMPLRSMSPSTVEVTSVSSTPRAAAMLARPAVRQPASAWSRYSTGVGPCRRRRAPSGGRRRRVNDVLVGALLADAEEAVDRALAVGAGHPAVRGPELELGRRRRRLHGVEGGEQGGGVDAVADAVSRWWSLVCLLSLWLVSCVGCWWDGASAASETAKRARRATATRMAGASH